MDAVIPRTRIGDHVVAIDRFYSSVPLSIELLANKVYTVGAIMTSRIGYAAEVIDKRAKKPKAEGKGAFRLAVNKRVPAMVVLPWMDSKPVHFLATGASNRPDTVQRRISSTQVQQVPCPKLIRDYHRWMGAVNVHEQLQLQRYSLLLAFVYKKHFKARFLGLVDMALVNAYLVHKLTRQKMGRAPLPRGDFLKVLQEVMLAITPQAFDQASEDDATAPTPSLRAPHRRQGPTSTEHIPEECPDMFTTTTVDKKRRQWACKVCAPISCSLVKEDQPFKCGNSTKWLCSACSKGDRRFYLCNIVRGEGPNPSPTCFQVHHSEWDCGRNIPMQCQWSKTQIRPPGDKRKRKRRPEDDEDETKKENLAK